MIPTPDLTGHTMNLNAIISNHTIKPFDSDDTLSDLGLDDVARMSVAHEIWEESGIDIPDCEVERWDSVGDIESSVRKAGGEGVRRGA